MKNYFNELLEYEFWANDEVIRSILTLDNPPEKILSLMSHIVNAQILWLSRIQNITTNQKGWQLYDKQELVNISKDIAGKLNEYLNMMSEDELERLVSYTNTKGESFQSNVRDILTHLTHHSSYHRGQVILLLKEKVTVLPYVDYIHFVRNIKKMTVKNG